MKKHFLIIVSSLLVTISGLFAQYPNVRLTLNTDQHETAIAINPVNPKWLL